MRRLPVRASRQCNMDSVPSGVGPRAYDAEVVRLGVAPVSNRQEGWRYIRKTWVQTWREVS